jgi:ammonia channel protein AmtB
MEIDSQRFSLVLLGAALLAVLGPAGIATYHIGLVRAKNGAAVGVARIADVALAGILFWLVGSRIAPVESDADFIARLGFAMVGACVVGGAAAERIRIRAHLAVVAVFAALFQPVFARLTAVGSGLASDGLVDLGGALGVHALAGATALGAAIATGARAGRLARGGGMVRFEAGNAPVAAFGATLFLLALLGLAGGPSPRPFLHALLGAAGGGLAGLGGMLVLRRTPDPVALIKGALAGAIALGAGAAYFPTPLAPLAGFTAGLVMIGIDRLLEMLRIDDATSTVGVHLGGGVWGALALGFLGDVSLIGQSRGSILVAQLTGIVLAVGGGLACGWGVLRLVGLFSSIKVNREQERDGLALAEHHVPSEAASPADLAPDEVRIDVREEAPVEPFLSAARVTFEPGGIITSANPLASAIFGYAENELIGLEVTALFAQRPDAPWDMNTLGAALAGGKHTTYGVTRSGEELLMEAQLQATMGDLADTIVLREVDHPHIEGLSPAQVEIQDRLARELADTHLVPSRDLPADALLPGGEVAARVSPRTQWFGYYYDPKQETITIYVGEVLAEGGAASLLSAIAGSSYGSDYTHGLLLGNPRYPVDRQLRNLAEVLNRIVLSTGKGEISIGMSFLHVQLGTGEAMFLSAGHRSPILVKSGGKLRELEGGGKTLGLSTDPDFLLRPLTLSNGDVVVAWSAGMIDTFGDSGEAFSFRELRKLVSAHEDTRGLRDAILGRAVEVFGEDEGQSALVFRYVPKVG